MPQAAVPAALKKAQPGTAEFRAGAARRAREHEGGPGAHGVFTMGPNDHLGLDQRARDGADPEGRLEARPVSGAPARSPGLRPGDRPVPISRSTRSRFGSPAGARGGSRPWIFQIALILGQDGITNGAIYALLALALVLVFAVTG